MRCVEQNTRNRPALTPSAGTATLSGRTATLSGGTATLSGGTANRSGEAQTTLGGTMTFDTTGERRMNLKSSLARWGTTRGARTSQLRRKVLKRLFALLALLGPSLLGRCAAGEPAQEPAEEHATEVVTQWNGATELFMEYPALLAGEPTGNWAIHLTAMDNFKPITAGTLTVRFLAAGQEPSVFTIQAPARAGIFLIDPVVESAGVYDVELELESPQAKSVHRIPGVRVSATAAELPHAEPEDEAGIAFLKEQQWAIDFAVVPAAEEEIARSVAVPGEIVPVDGALAAVASPVSGLALAASNRNAPSVGEFVEAGQVLAVLSPAAGESGYTRARAQVERLTREVARAERLLAVEAIPEKRLEETRHDLEIAQAELAAMGGELNAGDYRYRLRSPIGGFIAERNFLPGARIEAGVALFKVVDPRTVWLRVQMPAAAATALPRDARATFTLEGDRRVYRTSRLTSVGSTLDPDTRTVPVVFAVDNPAGSIKIGQ